LFSVIQSSVVKLSSLIIFDESNYYLKKYLSSSVVPQHNVDLLSNVFLGKVMESIQNGVLDSDAGSFSHLERCRRVSNWVQINVDIKERSFCFKLVYEIMQYLIKEVTESPSEGYLQILDVIFSNIDKLYQDSICLNMIFNFLNTVVIDWIGNEQFSKQSILLILHSIGGSNRIVAKSDIDSIKQSLQLSAKNVWHSTMLKIDTYDSEAVLRHYHNIFSDVMFNLIY
jgi:hypothetical protein